MNIGEHAAKDAYLTSKLPYIPRDRVCLYDLVADPAERINLASRPEYADDLRELSAVLDKWMRDTNDPLIDGPIPLRPGQVANRTDAATPFDPVYDWQGNRVEKLRDKKK